MILHLCPKDKFIKPFYDFMEEEFSEFDERHQFYVNGGDCVYKQPEGANVYYAAEHVGFARYYWLLKNMYAADKIILHALWDLRALQLLAIQPWLLKKCYWVIWGGDLYTYKIDPRTMKWWWIEIFRRVAIRRFGNMVTHVGGDVELARKWYGAKGRWHKCFVYPSNLYSDPAVATVPHEGINILVGNSADPSNHHLEALEMLRKHVDENIQIFCPLSYGDAEYAKKVVQRGKSIFGEKFHPLLEFMAFEEYRSMLARIDIAIFNHSRQQGMGNIVGLLGLGKKIYLRNDITTWQILNDIGLAIGDINNIQLTLLDEKSAKRNKEKISIYFSRQNLVEDLEKLFSA